MVNFPNLITFLRISAVPVFLILLSAERYEGALALFVFTAATDSLDGAIARLTQTHTVLGAYIDPLADKLLLVSSFVFLTSAQAVPLWLTILVISRDVVIVVGFAALFLSTGRLIDVRPTLVGKGTTFFQLLTVVLALLSLSRPDWNLALLRQCSVVLAGGATVLSGLQYLLRGFSWLGEREAEESSLLSAGAVREEADETRYRPKAG